MYSLWCLHKSLYARIIWYIRHSRMAGYKNDSTLACFRMVHVVVWTILTLKIAHTFSLTRYGIFSNIWNLNLYKWLVAIPNSFSIAASAIISWRWDFVRRLGIDKGSHEWIAKSVVTMRVSSESSNNKSLMLMLLHNVMHFYEICIPRWEASYVAANCVTLCNS